MVRQGRRAQRVILARWGRKVIAVLLVLLARTVLMA
jgi:hypothetical protein